MYVEHSGYCPYCNQRRLLHRHRVNHILHILLAIITAGFWLLVWIFLCVASSFEPWRCASCGSIVERDFWGTPKLYPKARPTPQVNANKPAVKRTIKAKILEVPDE